MEKRARLILSRARGLFVTAHPGEAWPEASDHPDAEVLARRAKYLGRAEDQLLKEKKIENVDQS